MAPSKLLPRPNTLIDALDGEPKQPFSGRVWRAVRVGYDVLRAARAGARWDDGTFDVLYTSLAKDGAIAERRYHLSQGQPLIPSRPKYVAYELEISLKGMLDLSDHKKLESLGVDVRKFGALAYVEKHQEYPSTQQIAEVAHFLEFDGILVQSARWDCKNLVIFSERIRPEDLSTVGKPEPIDWRTWETKTKKS